MPPEHPLQQDFVPGEQLGVQYDLGSSSFDRLTVTSHRCFLWASNGKDVTDFERNKLSSIDFSAYAMWPVAVILVIGAIALFATSAHLDESFPGLLGVLVLLASVTLLFEVESVKLWVTGRADAISITKVRYLWQAKEVSLRGLLASARQQPRP